MRLWICMTLIGACGLFAADSQWEVTQDWEPKTLGTWNNFMLLQKKSGQHAIEKIAVKVYPTSDTAQNYFSREKVPGKKFCWSGPSKLALMIEAADQEMANKIEEIVNKTLSIAEKRREIWNNEVAIPNALHWHKNLWREEDKKAVKEAVAKFPDQIKSKFTWTEAYIDGDYWNDQCFNRQTTELPRTMILVMHYRSHIFIDYFLSQLSRELPDFPYQELEQMYCLIRDSIYLGDESEDPKLLFKPSVELGVLKKYQESRR